MKKNTFCILLFVTFSLFISSCKKDKKDEPDTTKKSYLKIGDVQYDLSEGIYAIEYDEENQCFEVCIFLYSGFRNVYLYDMDSFYGEGTGSGIMIWLNSTKNEIVPKHYINGSEDLYDCEEIVYFGEADSNAGVFEYGGESNDDGVGGVIVSKDGEKYEITFDFEGAIFHGDQVKENQKIKGYFYGKLTQ